MIIKEMGKEVKPEKGMIVFNASGKQGVIVKLRPLTFLRLEGFVDSTYRAANPVKVKTFTKGFKPSKTMISTGNLFGRLEMAIQNADSNKEWGTGQYHAG